MKKIMQILLVGLIVTCLFACGKKASNEQASNNAAANTTAVTNSASTNVPAEYKQVTTNENGVKIYGKKLAQSEPMYNTMRDPAQEERGAEKGITWTYTQYFSEAYGGMVYIKTNNTSGGQDVYNENGQQFLSNDSKAAKYDLENTLAKYRLGNAMAEAIDRKVNGK